MNLASESFLRRQDDLCGNAVGLSRMKRTAPLYWNTCTCHIANPVLLTLPRRKANSPAISAPIERATRLWHENDFAKVLACVDQFLRPGRLRQGKCFPDNRFDAPTFNKLERVQQLGLGALM